MNRRTKGVLAVVGALAIGLSAFVATGGAAPKGKSKTQRLGTSTQVETSTKRSGRSLTVEGLIESSTPRCEKQRSVLLYEVGPTGDFVGGAVGHGVSEGGSELGQVVIVGQTVKKITPTRRFRLEAVGRKVKIKGKEVICKRGVSASFLADFNPTG